MGRLPVVFFVEPTFGFDENLASEALTPGGYMLSAIARRGCRLPADPTHIHSHLHQVLKQQASVAKIHY
jgi:hypothetical protein